MNFERQLQRSENAGVGGHLGPQTISPGHYTPKYGMIDQRADRSVAWGQKKKKHSLAFDSSKPLALFSPSDKELLQLEDEKLIQSVVDKIRGRSAAVNY